MLGLLIRGVVWLALALLLRPSRDTSAPPPPTLDDVNIPGAQEGVEFGRIWGSPWIEDPHSHWYGDLGLRPITTTQSKK